MSSLPFGRHRGEPLAGLNTCYLQKIVPRVYSERLQSAIKAELAFREAKAAWERAVATGSAIPRRD